MYSTAYASSARWGVAPAERIASVAGAPPPDFSLQLPASPPSAVLSVRIVTRGAAREERLAQREAQAASAVAPPVSELNRLRRLRLSQLRVLNAR